MRISRLVRLGLIVFGILLGVGSGELVARVWERFQSRVLISDVRVKTPQSYDYEAKLAELLQASSHPAIPYELRPNLKASFLGKKVTTNSEGMRSSQVARRLKKEKLIFGIGDSLMFGWGVNDGEEYLSLLERKLNRKSNNTDWKVINAAVPGYNTEVEVSVLKAKGIDQQPEIVVLGFVESNDFELPYFARQRPEVFTLSRSYLYDSFSCLFFHPLDTRQADGFYVALSQLQLLQSQHRFKVIVYIHEQVTDRTLQTIEQFGFRIVQAWPILERRLQGGGLAEYKRSKFVVSPDDPHPSSLGHRLAARLLYETLGLGES